MSDSSRKQANRPKKSKPQHQEETAGSSSAMHDELEHILDEIDEVLEENAEEFVKSYVQKGGE